MPCGTGDEMGFVQRLQTALLGQCLAPWLRKGSAWLDINCGEGLFLPLLLQHGCNAEATEADPAARALAHKLTGGSVDIAAAAGERLPYADNYFDYAVLHLEAHAVSPLTDALEEMARVAERGIAVTFWNTSSLGAMGDFGGLAPQSMSWGSVRAALKALGKGRVYSGSTLCLPPSTWRDSAVLANCNALCGALPVGAWMVAWIDFKPRQTGTPLTLRLPFARTGETAMNQ